MADTGVVGLTPDEASAAFAGLPPINLPSVPADQPIDKPWKVAIDRRDSDASGDWFASSVVPEEAANKASPASQPTQSSQPSQTDWFSSNVVPAEAVEQQSAPSTSQQKPPISVGEDVRNTLLGQTLPMAAVAPLGAVTYPLRLMQQGADYLGSGAANMVRGALGKPKVPDQPFQPDFSTPDEMLNDVADTIGHPLYQPQTTTGKYIDTVGQFLLGGGWAGATSKAKTLSDIADNVAKTIVPSVVGGIASETGGEGLQGTPFEKPARIVGAILGGHAPSIASKTLEPMGPNGRTNIAARDIMQNAEDPDDLNNSIQARQQINQSSQQGNPSSPISPNQNQSVAELSPNDQKLAMYQKQVLQSAQGLGGNGLAAQLNDVQSARQEANQKFLQAMQSGNPDDVGQFFTSHIDQLNKEHDAMLGTQKALSDNLVPDSELSDAGASATSQFEAGRAAAKTAEDQAWAELEPYKQIPADAGLIQDTAAENARQIDPMAGDSLHPVEQQLYNTVNAWGNNAQPFGRITSFARNLNDAISEVGRQQGFKSATVQRLMKLKDSVKKTVSGKVGEIHTAEAELARKGEMPLDQTIFHNLANERENWKARKSATGGSGPNPASDIAGHGAVGTQTVRDPGRAKIQKAGGRGNAKGNKGLPENGGLELAPHEVFNKANKSTQDRASTFDNPKVLREAFSRQNNEYKLAEGQRAEKLFPAGEGGAKAIQGAKKAGISEDVIGNVALNKLRKDGVLNPDGSVNAVRLQKWRTRHASSLSELPKLSRKLSDVDKAQQTLANNAARNRAMKDSFNESAASKFVGNEKPEKVIGKILAGKSPASDIDDVLARIGKDQAALDGLRGATLEHLEGKFSGSDSSLKKSLAYKQYLKDNSGHLTKLLGRKSYVMLGRMIDDNIGNLQTKSVKAPVGKTSVFTGLKGLFHGHGTEAGMLATAGTLIAEHGTHIITSHPYVAAMSGLGVLAKALHSAGINKLSQLKADMVLNPEKYASAFTDYQKEKGAPILLQRNLSSTIMRVTPSAEAVSDERSLQPTP